MTQMDFLERFMPAFLKIIGVYVLVVLCGEREKEVSKSANFAGSIFLYPPDKIHPCRHLFFVNPIVFDMLDQSLLSLVIFFERIPQLE